jgi:NADPH:quinone reductase-like Zn-dependent oxidoreductase
VLVHAATGGLGLAAVQVARALGASVVGTAGSASKRAFLRGYAGGGALPVLDSRTTAFAAEAAALGTAGGVDVVLNSLTSPGMVAASLAALQRGGTFCEVGKRDIWSAARVAQERPDVALHTVAVDFMPPRVVQQGLTRIAAMLGTGESGGMRLS